MTVARAAGISDSARFRKTDCSVLPLQRLTEDAGTSVSVPIAFQKTKVLLRRVDWPGAGTQTGIHNGHGPMDGAGDREEEILFTNGVHLAAGVGRVSIDQHVGSVRSESLIDPIDPDARKAHYTRGRWRLMKFGAQHPAAEDYRCMADEFASGSVGQRAAATRGEKRWE